jgi:hypothetical protein
MPQRLRPSRPPGLPQFTGRQRDQLGEWHQLLGEAAHWHGQLPVVVLDRCWLQLKSIPVEDLARALPPDSSADAPELVRYRDLIQAGEPSWAAQMQCWQDFGPVACQQALQRFWDRQERGNHGWTLTAYLQLVEGYREPWTTGKPRRLPLLVLARANQAESHSLHWLDPLGQPVRHTCL